MNTLNIFLLSILLTSVAHAQVTCETFAKASCLTTNGMCYDFFESEFSDPEMWGNLCEEAEGILSESPCDIKETTVKCLTATNIVMPVVHFLKEFEVEEATNACMMIQGKVCKNIP